jgi:hypothetical protein
MRTQIINDIVNEMINILIIDYKESESNSHDKKFIDYKYYNHMTINAIIKKITPLCIRDYSADIIRDEVYASLYEIMVNKVAPDFTDEELEIILNDIHTKAEPVTNKFLVSLYKLTILRAKLQLSGYRRGSKGMIPARDELEYTEEIFNNSPTHNYGLEITNPDDDISFFTSWFNENCADFLTDNQLKFIDDPTNIKSKNHSQYKKRIYNKTLTEYEKQFDSTDERINKVKSQITLIESILESEDFVAQIIKHQDKSYILDALTSYVPLKLMRAFNLGDRNPKVIKSYRVALFKQLNNLNQLLKTEI